MPSLRTIGLSLACCVCLATPAEAQREQLRNLLNDLIESQIRRGQRGNRPGRVNFGPGGGTSRPGVVGQPARPLSAEDLRRLNAVRPLAAEYVNASADLVKGMHDNLARVPGMRTLLPRALQLNATSAAFSRRLRDDVRPDYVLSTLQQIDQQHRALGFQLSQVDQLPENCRRCLATLDGLRDRLDAIYGVQPQIDMRKIDELSGALTVTLNALVEDVAIELRGDRNWRTLVQHGRQVQSQCRNFRFTCAEAHGRDTVVAEFQAYLKLWSPYADELENFNNPYLDRGVRRAHALNRQLAQQLLLPAPVDRTLARHLGELIDTELKSLCGFINLNVMNTIPNGAALPPLAKQLRLQTNAYCDCVNRDDDLRILRTRWRELHETWTRFSFELTPIRNQRIRTTAGQLDDAITGLRDVLGIIPQFDLAQVCRLAANVDSLSGEISVQVDRWAAREKAGRAVRADLRAFHDVCHTFHNAALDRREARALLTQCDQLVAAWHNVHPKIMKCDSPEAVALNRLAEQLTLTLVQLETLLQ